MGYKYALILLLILIISACNNTSKAEDTNSTKSLDNNSQEEITSETPKVKTPEELIEEANTKAAKIVGDANNKASQIEDLAIIKADSLEIKASEVLSVAEKKSSDIISEAEEKAKELTSKARYRKEFFEQNSILLLSIFSLLVIAYLAYLLREFYLWRAKVNDNTVELPEVFRSDWKELVDQLSHLSTKEEILAADKELMKELELYRENLKRFATNISTSAKNHKEEYTEGLIQLTKELELRKKENAELKEGYAINEKKKIFDDLLNLKEKIQYKLTTKDDEFLHKLNKLIDKIFSRIGIEKIHFDKGTSIEDGNIKPDEAEQIGFIEPVGDEKEYTVHKTEKIGYSIKGLNQHKEVIIPAKIIVYKAKEIPKKENDLEKKDLNNNDSSKKQIKDKENNIIEVEENNIKDKGVEK
jgi:hypothetical protein